MRLWCVYLSPVDGGHPETLPQCLLVHGKTAEANPQLVFTTAVISFLICNLRMNISLLHKHVHACQHSKQLHLIKEVCGKLFVRHQKWSSRIISCYVMQPLTLCPADLWISTILISVSYSTAVRSFDVKWKSLCSFQWESVGVELQHPWFTLNAKSSGTVIWRHLNYLTW